jgi:hypothetical protein
MPKADLRLTYDSMKGKSSKYVYRDINGKMYCFPRKRPEDESPAVQEVRRRFKRAHLYAKAVADDPVRLAPYEALAASRNEQVRRIIVTDYLKSPTVDLIDLDAFSGAIGDVIRVEATDDCEVMGVNVQIRSEDDTLLEEGAATYHVEKMQWEFTTTVAYPRGAPVSITATAVDRPGHKGTKMTTWG